MCIDTSHAFFEDAVEPVHFNSLFDARDRSRMINRDLRPAVLGTQEVREGFPGRTRYRAFRERLEIHAEGLKRENDSSVADVAELISKFSITCSDIENAINQHLRQ